MVGEDRKDLAVKVVEDREVREREETPDEGVEKVEAVEKVETVGEKVETVGEIVAPEMVVEICNESVKGEWEGVGAVSLLIQPLVLPFPVCISSTLLPLAIRMPLKAKSGLLISVYPIRAHLETSITITGLRASNEIWVSGMQRVLQSSAGRIASVTSPSLSQMVQVMAKLVHTLTSVTMGAFLA
jgi:hypothetical protein